jgi:polyhydroxyalkanoate synthesis regulator phasin
MHFTKKTILIGIAAAALAVTGVLGAAGFGAYHYVAAKFTPSAAVGQSVSGSSIMSDYWTVFLKNFAANLGVDQGKLDQAFTAAVSATVDQAVKDGKMTQAEADSIKSRNSAGLSGAPGMNPFGRGGEGGEGGRGGKGGPGMNGMDGMRAGSITTADIAAALGMTEADVTSGLQAGKSISDLAAAQSKDLAAVKAALLAAVKARLDAAVTAGSLTQAQADAFTQKLTTSIDALLTSTSLIHGKSDFGRTGGMGRMGAEMITTADIAAALGMTEADVTAGLQSGKSVADLAAAQSKDLAAVKEALLAAQKARLDQAVSAGTLTQAQADSAYQALTSSIDSLLSQAGGMPGGRRGGGRGGPGMDGGQYNNQDNNNSAPAPSQGSNGA